MYLYFAFVIVVVFVFVFVFTQILPVCTIALSLSSTCELPAALPWKRLWTFDPTCKYTKHIWQVARMAFCNYHHMTVFIIQLLVEPKRLAGHSGDTRVSFNAMDQHKIKYSIVTSHFLMLIICKGWLAIVKLKPLSLFISLFLYCKMLS